jgi:hypothetical protein
MDPWVRIAGLNIWFGDEEQPYSSALFSIAGLAPGLHTGPTEAAGAAVGWIENSDFGHDERINGNDIAWQLYV